MSHRITRREFLRRAGILTAAGGLFAVDPTRSLAQSLNSGGGTAQAQHTSDETDSQPAEQDYPNLVGVRNAEPAALFDAGIAALGGMSRFVKPGDRAVIKPNASWNIDPSRGATTTPSLIGRIAEHCFEARARQVSILDHTIDTWHLAYEATGMKRYAERSDARLVPGNSESLYQTVQIPGGKNLESTKVHEVVLEADVLINVPILKDHGSTRMTCALKNLMGLVWNRWYYHSHGLNQCIADFPLYRTPDLNVVDAYTVMTSGGPRGSSHRSNLEIQKMQILSPDIVAADSAAAQTFGAEPADIRHIPLAAEHGLGTMDLDALKIERITL